MDIIQKNRPEVFKLGALILKDFDRVGHLLKEKMAPGPIDKQDRYQTFTAYRLPLLPGHFIQCFPDAARIPDSANTRLDQQIGAFFTADLSFFDFVHDVFHVMRRDQGMAALGRYLKRFFIRQFLGFAMDAQRDVVGVFLKIGPAANVVNILKQPGEHDGDAELFGLDLLNQFSGSRFVRKDGCDNRTPARQLDDPFSVHS